MTRRPILAATTALLSVAMSFHPQVAAVLDNPAWAADTAKPQPGRPASGGAGTLVDKALRAMDGAEEIVFVVRDLCSAYQWYATFGEYADETEFIHAPDGSQLCKLNLRTRQVTVLLDDPKGGFRDPRVHYDGGKILFAYRPGGTHHYHLYEINVDGSGFRQLTSGDCDDLDPAYLPDGGIVFASSRCNRFVACNRVPAAIIHRMDAEGDNIRCLSANTISEDRPAVLPDGRIVYTRWDYTDRDPEKFRDLWVMNPDGTGQMVLFGGVGRPYPTFFAKCDALPVPGADGKIVSVFSPAFGRRENAGNVMLVDVKAGPGEWSAARQISPELPDLGWSIGSGQGREGFRDPYPLSTGCFLVARDKSLLVLDDTGATEEFCRAEKMVHDPRVIRPRLREPVLPTRADLQKTTGQLVLTDVYRGRNMAGIKPGTIKELLVLEDLPKPGSKHGLPGYHGGYITLRRVLGTVPVEADGSASFEVPALRAVYFVALDENGVAVKRMQNFTTVMPGETQGCVGCHEPRTGNPDSRIDGDLMALRRFPNQIAPVDGVPDVFDYPRDIQPIWDRHCVACHNSEKPDGRVVLTGDNNEWFTQSYSALLAYDQVSQCSSWGEDGNHPPYGFGTGASPLMQKIDGSHYEVKLTQREHDKVRLWIETGAGFTGTYAVFNHPENAVATPLVVSKPELGSPVAPIVKRRCLTCHGSVANLGRRSKQQRDDQWSNGKPPTLLNYPLYCWNLYNLSFPEKSMILRASLTKEAGGYAWCQAEDGQPAAAFRNTNDPDYQAILQAIQAAKVRQERYGRPDIRGFRPGDYYVRWMKRFGILPENFDPATDRIDPYETDRAYWRSLWYQPPSVAFTDKDTGFEIFYRQSVIKPALIGMLGAWTSGGVEWNFPHHHRATTFMPVDYRLTENAGGSKTVWTGETEIRSGDAVLGLDGATGAPVRLADAGAGLELAGGGQELFRLVVIPPGADPRQPLELSSRDAKAVTRIEGDGVRLRFEGIGNRNLAAVCAVETGTDGLFRFRITVEGESGATVERVDYPLLPLAAPLEGDGAGDAVVLGTTKGGVLERPHQWKPGRSAAGTQPGNLAAQFGCYYGPNGGVVTYCEDDVGYPKTLAAVRTTGGIVLGWRHLMRHDLKEPVALAFPVVVGLFRGKGGAATDWRDAAAVYKTWALKQPWCAKRLAERDDLPDWLKQGPAQVRFGREWLGQPERIEAWLEEYWAKHFEGVPLIVTFWGWEGVATWVPPQYFPPYPSEDGLKRCVDAVRRAGGHAFFWPSGYQWCLSYGEREDGSFDWEDRARFEREAKPHAMIGKDGEVMLTNPPWYRGGEAATLCRGDKWSRDWLTGIAVGLAERGGELFQIDQVVGAGMRGGGDCRATTHRHPPGIGIWDVEAAHRQMTEMQAACRAAGVNMVLGYEEPQELFLQEVGIQDYRDYEVVRRSYLPDHRPESVFGYLYHEFVPLFQSNPRGDDCEMTAHCIVTGQMPHLVPHWPVEPHVFPLHGGFEEWFGDVPVGWEHVKGWRERKFSGRPRWDQSIRHSDASSLRLENALAGEITQVSRNLPIGPAGLHAGGTYRLSAWCRTERLERPAAINIAALTRDLKSRGSWKLPFPAPGDWQEVSVDAVVPADGAEMVRVMIHVDGPCRVWVDDFRVAEVDAQGAARPIVRDGLPSQHQLYKQWIELYHGAGRPYLQFGIAIPPPTVEPTGAVAIGAFRAADGSEAAIAANPTDTTRQATLRWDGKSKRVELMPSEVKLLPR